MVTIILLGILTSVISEAVTALNKKLQGTVLQGNAAFLITFVIAFLGAFIKEVTAPGFTWSQFGDYNAIATTLGEVFTISQLYFVLIVKKLGLDVQDPSKFIETSEIKTSVNEPSI